MVSLGNCVGQFGALLSIATETDFHFRYRFDLTLQSMEAKRTEDKT